MSIVKITIDIDGKDTELTIDQAKEVYQTLKKVFDTAPVYISFPSAPYYGEIDKRWPSITPITCGSVSSSKLTDEYTI